MPPAVQIPLLDADSPASTDPKPTAPEPAEPAVEVAVEVALEVALEVAQAVEGSRAPSPAAGADDPDLGRISRSLHELIPPLSAVVGFSDLLQDDDSTGDERRRHARAVYESGRELEQKIRSLLADIQAGIRRRGKRP
jgi:signal transduction histidine kinase